MQYNESDLSVLLLGMGYTARQVQSVLNELRDETDEDQLYDVNTALETLIRQGHLQPGEQPMEEKEAADDGETVPVRAMQDAGQLFTTTLHTSDNADEQQPTTQKHQPTSPHELASAVSSRWSTMQP